MTPANLDRAANLTRLSDEVFDVVVIGGGITGVGVALDAANRGLRTAVVERADFASGTSSKSSKLIHGGLRYLQQREIGLVYEGLHERQRLRRNAPHLVRLLPFMIPVFSKDGLLNPKVARALGSVLWMYDITGGWRIGKLHKRLGHDEALAHMPTLPSDRLASGYLYYDAAADDARLVITIARTAAAEGAVLANYTEVVAIEKNTNGRIHAVVVEADGTRFPVRARAVVNASGVWSDTVRGIDEGADPESIRPAKGIHITVARSKIRNDIAVVLPVPHDRRSLFVVPHGELTYIGTTDTDYDGPLDDPQCTADDISYILRAANVWISGGLTAADIVGTWAGLRPLVRTASSARTADLSRRHAVSTSASGVVTVTGGKLTTYRRMAADAVDAIAEPLKVRTRSGTSRLELIGAAGFREPDEGDSSLNAHLARRYGTEASSITKLLAEQPHLGNPLVPGLPYIRAEAVWAVRHEMARTVDDVLTRRTRSRLLARDASAAAAAAVASLIAPELAWSPAEAERQAMDYQVKVTHERQSANLPETALDAALGA